MSSPGAARPDPKPAPIPAPIPARWRALLAGLILLTGTAARAEEALTAPGQAELARDLGLALPGAWRLVEARLEAQADLGTAAAPEIRSRLSALLALAEPAFEPAGTTGAVTLVRPVAPEGYTRRVAARAVSVPRDGRWETRIAVEPLEALEPPGTPGSAIPGRLLVLGSAEEQAWRAAREAEMDAAQRRAAAEAEAAALAEAHRAAALAAAAAEAGQAAALAEQRHAAERQAAELRAGAELQVVRAEAARHAAELETAAAVERGRAAERQAAADRILAEARLAQATGEADARRRAEAADALAAAGRQAAAERLLAEARQAQAARDAEARRAEAMADALAAAAREAAARALLDREDRIAALRSAAESESLAEARRAAAEALEAATLREATARSAAQRVAIEERSRQVADLRARFAGDRNVRLAAMDQAMRSEDPAIRALGYESALASQDAVAISLALRLTLLQKRELQVLTFAPAIVAPGQADPQEVAASVAGFTISLRDINPTNGNFAGTARLGGSEALVTGTLGRSELTVALRPADREHPLLVGGLAQEACSLALRLSEVQTLDGVFTCTAKDTPRLVARVALD